MKRATTQLILSLGLLSFLGAQEGFQSGSSFNYYNPKNHSVEIGLHGGHFFSSGNIDFVPGYAVGIHARRALDHVFSLRLELLYGSANGEDDGNLNGFSNNFYSGTAHIVAALNNLKWNMRERRTNLYTLVGVGLNTFDVSIEENGEKIGEIGTDLALNLNLGAGIAFRINEKINIAIEHQAIAVMGNRSDLIDGTETLTSNASNRRTFSDILNYSNVRFNFNIGKSSSNTEPLYWLNPLETIINDVTLLKDTRVNMSDMDADGVIDQLDEEEATPEEAPVNVKGIAVDSDGDGLKDYEDKEPYSPMGGFEIDDEGVAQLPDIDALVNKLVEEKLKELLPAKDETEKSKVEIVSWYLPTIYFPSGSTQVQASDYGKVAAIGKVIRENPKLKFVITGHADVTGSAVRNNQLSYERALSVINYLVEKHKINRERLLLQWKGEDNNLVEGMYDVNRRVEVKVAGDEVEMAAPKPGN